jgi:glycosyltransferase involved in cell wall biosynthesis
MGAYLPLSRIRPGGIPTTLFVHELLLDTTRHAFRFLIALSGVPVVANSRATADWLVGLRVPDARISVMYPMLPSEFGQHAEQSRREGPLPGERFVIACIGRINGKKGQELLLRAAEECSTPVELVFAGGPYRGQEHHHEALLAAATRSPVPVTYLGEVADVAPVMSTAHAVAVPSLTPEPFGIVALEAATLGIPLILARHGGLVEIGERAPSVMFTPASLTGLANAIDIVAASYDDLLAREPAPDLAAIAGGQQRRAAWKTMLAELVV